MQNIDCSHRFKLEQVDGAPSHIPAPAQAHISLHIKIPKCVSRVLIHRAITFDTFKVLAKKPKRSWVTIKISDPKSYFLMASDPQTCPTAPLYFPLHYFQFDMQHDFICTKWTLDPSGPHPLVLPPGVYIKILNVFLQFSSIGLLPVTASRL